jgi:energy-coupling factor transporter transmembrane protein EcfT
MKKILSISKICALLLFNYFIFLTGSPIILTGLLFAFIFVGLFVYYPFIKRLKIILPVAVMILFFQLIFNTSIPSIDRLLLGYAAAIRLIAISLSVLLFLTVTSISELLETFSFLPKKVVLVILMTSYFIPGVLNEAEKIKAVQKSRGMNLNSIHIITNLASLIVPLLHRVLQRAEILSINIIARGYED